MLKGYRTIILNALLVGLGPILDYLVNVNWVDITGPTGAIVVMGVLNMLMRFVTTTPVGQNE